MVIYAKFYNKQIRDENICLYIQLNKSDPGHTLPG